MQATVVITTKNRRDDALKAVASAVEQTARPEVLVIDDGSTDGTAEAVASQFPSVRVQRSEQSLGLVVQRNRAARMASHEILFSIDDDAVFSTPKVVEQTLRDFAHPKIGAVAIPFVDVNRSPKVNQRAPHPDAIFATYYFIGTAHALRRNVFQNLGGYREVLIHQGEEEDYCVRMLNSGWLTRCGNADPIHHFESLRRNWTRMDFYGARNKVLYAWHNIPWPYLPMHLACTTALTSIHSREPRRFVTRIRGIIDAYRLIASRKVKRAPVTPETYRLSRALKRRTAIPFDEIILHLRANAVHSLQSTENNHCVATNV